MVTLFNLSNSYLNVFYKIPTNFQKWRTHYLLRQTTIFPLFLNKRLTLCIYWQDVFLHLASYKTSLIPLP